MRFSLRAGILLFFLIGFWIARPSPARADQVILTYGDRISGSILSVTRQVVRIESQAAGIIQIERKYVAQLSTDAPRVVDLVSGERVIGQILGAGGKTVVVRSSVLGERTITLEAIEAVEPVARSENGGTENGALRSESGTEEGVNPVPLAEIRAMGTGPALPSGRQAASPAPTQQPKPIGQKPEDIEDIRKIFLRQSTVLLNPGQFEIEAALDYLHTQAFSAILNARFRQFQLPLTARLGLFQRAEGSISIPVAYAKREIGFADSVVSNQEAGIGDVRAGLNYELASETARRPDIITSFVLEGPSGSKPNEQGLSLGSGHWAMTFGAQFIKTVDPVALFGGISYGHQFAASYFLGDAVHNVDPGEIAGYNFGFGFAVNENVSLSAQVIGSYQSDAKADGVKVFASSREPVTLRSALTYRYSKGTFIEPSIVIGLDDDTQDFALGISLTHRFGK